MAVKTVDTGVLRAPDGRPVVWKPQRGQILPFMVPGLVKEILLHGNRGSGKSDILLNMFARYVAKGYGAHWRGMIFKRTNPETDALFEKARILFQALCPDIKYTTHPYKVFRWPTGEILTIRHMFDLEDYNAVHGSELGFLGWDELTNWPVSDVYLKTMSLLRSSHPQVSQHLQVVTTTNPGGPGNCIPYGEVLTANRGWVEISKVRLSDTVITVDAHGKAKVGAIADVVKVPYDGDMMVRKGRGIHMEFTPNHRLPLRTKTGFTLRPYNELPGQAMIKRSADEWETKRLEPFTVPPCASEKKTGKGRITLDQPDTLSPEDYGDFMGWFLSEGYTSSSEKFFGIAQVKEKGRAQIRDLLSRCGFKFRETPKEFIVHSPKWWGYLKQFGKCYHKFIPHELKEAPRPVLRKLFDSLMAGDGSENTYYTTSKQLADDVCEIAVKLGYRVYLSSRERPEISNYTQYAVNVSGPADIELLTGHHRYNVSTKSKKTNMETQHHSGMVYCLTVPETETFFVRQNGCVWLSGNTWVLKRWKLNDRNNDKKLIYDSIEDNEELAQWKDDPLVNIQSRPRVSLFIDVRQNEIFMKANPTYLADLAAQAPNDAVRKAWIDGDWSIVAGGMFYDLWEPKYHVLKPFNIPRSWKIDRAMDWGSATPFAVLWFAESDGSDYIDANGQWCSTVAGDIFIIHEWYGSNGQVNTGLKLTAREVAFGIVEREMEWKIYQRCVPGPADNQITQQFQAGQSIALDMLQPIRLDDGKEVEGVAWTRSDKNSGGGTRTTGWSMIRDRLKNAHPNENGIPREKPGLFVFDRCTDVLEHFPNAPRDEKNVEDLPKRGEYHIPDVIRYRVLDSGAAMKQGRTKGMG